MIKSPFPLVGKGGRFINLTVAHADHSRLGRMLFIRIITRITFIDTGCGTLLIFIIDSSISMRAGNVILSTPCPIGSVGIADSTIRANFTSFITHGFNCWLICIFRKGCSYTQGEDHSTDKQNGNDFFIFGPPNYVLPLASRLV